MHYDILIIGGGASALACALAIKEERADITVGILEAEARVGKKLLATGNGRCNISNKFAKATNYHSIEADAESFVAPAFAAYAPSNNALWFESFGLPLMTEGESGRQYPQSNQAASVLDVLRLTAAAWGVETHTDAAATNISRGKNGYTVNTANGTFTAKKLVIAWGGISSPQISAAQNRQKLCQSLKLESTGLFPALTQIKTAEKLPAALKGVRLNAAIKLEQNGKTVQQTVGELQFTEYGISGIPAFELSRQVSLQKQASTIIIDCLPNLTEAELLAHLQKRQSLNLTLEDYAVGILNKKLGQQLLKYCELAPLSRNSAELSAHELAQFAHTIKNLKLTATGVTGWQNSQVTAGGLKLSQFDPQTLACRKDENLFAIGEALDIDGDCGGYNLTWCWSSARLAAKNLCK